MMANLQTKTVPVVDQRGLTFDKLVADSHTKFKWLSVKLMKNPQEADDVLQDAYLRAFNAFSNFKYQSSFSTWMYRIISNAAWNRQKQLGRQYRLITNISDGTDSDNASDAGNAGLDELVYHVETPLSILEARESEQGLADALAKMERTMPCIYQAFCAVVLENRDYDEVSLEAGVHLGTMRSRVHRAREFLKKQLRDSDADILFPY